MENKIRIQPEMAAVPENNPFKHDLLNRKTAIEALTNVISNIEGPCVMAVDAPWGMGKTTFIRMWEQYLRDKAFPVASFNAWETDYFANPFSALSGEFLQELGKFKRNLPQLEALGKAVQSISSMMPTLIPVISSAIDGGMLGKSIVKAVEDYAAKESKDRRSTRRELEKFRKALDETARKLAEFQKHPLVIIIDELDRCRPLYAIELLELTKHFFSVDHIVFVLAINLTELSHSVRAVYGEQFNASNYLERFFDIDFKLPDVNREKFILSNFQAMKIDQYFKRTEDESAAENFPAIAKVFSSFLGKADISLREISQVMRRLGLVIAALPNNRPFLGWGSAMALIIRTIDFDLYERFMRLEVDDQEVIDSILLRPEFANFRNKHEGNLFEAVILTAHMGLRVQKLQADTLSPLYQKYLELAGGNPEVVASAGAKEHERATKIKKMMEHFEQDALCGSGGINFSYAVERIELFSADLTKKDTSQN